MSNLIQATVFAIGGSPIKGDPLSVYFPTHLISARDYSTSQLTDVNSQIDYYPNPNSQSQITPIWVGESVATLATEASTDMFPATVLAINTHGQNTPLNMLFPSVGTSVGPSSGTNIYSYIEFKGNIYYASELPSALVTAANKGGGGGVTIYTGDGSLTGNRVVTLGTHELEFDTSVGSVSISPTEGYLFKATDSDGNDLVNLDVNQKSALLAMRNNADNNSFAGFLAEANSAGDGVFFRALANGAGMDIKIVGDGVANKITYTADTHTFNGVINIPTQAAPVSPNDGDVWREDNTNTGLKIRINGVTKTIVVS